MFCNLTIPRPIFIISHKTDGQLIKYIFIGDISSSKYDFIEKLEKNIKLNKKDENEIDELFGKKGWINNTNKFIFIKKYINIDDTIFNLKNKIMSYLSSHDNILIPDNQELSYNDQTIGLFYNNIEPIQNSKFKIDYHFVDKDGFKITNNKLENDMNELIIDVIKISDNQKLVELNLIMFEDILKLLVKKNINIDNLVKYGYLFKYFPKANTNFDKNEYRKKIDELKLQYDKNEYIIDLIKSNDCACSADCNVITVIMYLRPKDYDKSNINNISNSSSSHNLDLQQLFNFLRRNLDDKIVFLKFKDIITDEIYLSLYKGALENELVDRDTLENWSYKKKKIGDEIKYKTPVPRGLVVKYFLYEINGIRKYSQINFFDNGHIQLEASFLLEKKANIYEIENAIHGLRDLIRIINKGLNLNIDEPKFEIINKGNDVIMSENLELSFINVVTDVCKFGEYNPLDLYNFALLFTPYVLPTEEQETIKTNIEKGDRLSFKYKRVSNFLNKPELYNKITELKKQQFNDIEIIKIIETKYYKKKSEAEDILKDWNRKHGYYGDQNVKIRSFGIDINIKDTRIEMKGISELKTITFVNKFILTMLQLYKKKNILFKDKKAIKYLLSKSSKFSSNKNDTYEIDYDQNTTENNKNLEINTEVVDQEEMNDYNINSNIEQYLYDIEENTVDPNTEELNSKIINKKSNIDTTDYQDFMPIPNEPINPENQLKCDDKIVELGTCQDFCNDDSYFLRRLQSFDSRLYEYKSSKLDKSRYSVACQSTGYRQPIILQYNPYNHPKVDQKSFSYAYKYGSDENHQYWYICPKVWCPYCQLPIDYDQLDNFRKRATRKGQDCMTAECPFSTKDNKHDVIIRGEYLYPGFANKKHPDGYCLPCCFKVSHQDPKYKAYINYKKCLGEEVENTNAESSIKYILNKTGLIEEGRFGLLLPDLQKIFNSKCESGYLKPNTSCYVRKGLKFNENQSFLACIADLVSDDKNNIISIDMFKDFIISKLDDKLFRSLNKGLVYATFKNISTNIDNSITNDDKQNEKIIKTPLNKKYKNLSIPLQNFIHFLKSNDTFINEVFLWDLLSRPGIITEEGINIIIFETSNIICPLALNSEEFFNIDKPTYFIIKMKKNYEPIYKLEVSSNDILLQWYFTSIDKNTQRILDIAMNECQPQKINWNLLLNENKDKFDKNNHYEFNFKPENTLKQTLELIKPKYQVVDQINRTIGIITDYLKYKNIFIPTKPDSIITSIKEIFEYELKSYKETYHYLHDISKNTGLNLKPLFKILSFDNDNIIIGFLLENNRIIPIEPIYNSLVNTDKLPGIKMTFYLDIDDKISQGSLGEELDERKLIINKLEYENESYERIRYTLSKEPPKIKEFIYNILNIPSSQKNMNEKREMLKQVLKPIICNIAHFTTKNIDLSNYKVPNNRFLCKYIKNKSVHCVKSTDNGKDEWKLLISKFNMINGKNNLDNILNLLSEELLRNKLKSKEIMDGLVPDIININKLEPNMDEILLRSHDIKEQIDNLYIKTDLYDIFKVSDYTYNLPNIVKQRPDLIISDSDSNEFNTSDIEELSTHWLNIFGNEFQVYKKSYIQSIGYLYEALSKVANTINSENKYNAQSIKELIINNIENYENDINKYFNFDNIIEGFIQLEPIVFKYVSTLSQIISIMQRKDYQGTYIDIFIFCNIFYISSLILNKRIGKDNPEGYIRIMEFKEYFILYSEKFNDIRQFNLVQLKNQIIFDKNYLKNYKPKFINNSVNDNE